MLKSLLEICGARGSVACSVLPGRRPPPIARDYICFIWINAHPLPARHRPRRPGCPGGPLGLPDRHQTLLQVYSARGDRASPAQAAAPPAKRGQACAPAAAELQSQSQSQPPRPRRPRSRPGPAPAMNTQQVYTMNMDHRQAVRCLLLLLTNCTAYRLLKRLLVNVGCLPFRTSGPSGWPASRGSRTSGRTSGPPAASRAWCARPQGLHAVLERRFRPVLSIANACR